MSLKADLIAVIDSILAEAGDERGPVQMPSKLDMFEAAIFMAEMREFPAEVTLQRWKNAFTNAVTDQRTIQGWVDRLRGIRAALRAEDGE